MNAPRIQTWSACPTHGVGTNRLNPCPKCLEQNVAKKKLPVDTVDHLETRRLVGVIDDQGTRLTRSQIDFIAGIIDGKQKKFTEAEERRVLRIYDEKVVNGKPEDDDI